MTFENHESLDDEPGNDENEKKKILKKRGPTTGKYMAQEDKWPVQLEWDVRHCPIGEFADRFKTYVGVCARTHIPISIDDWEHVDESLKETIWLDIQV